MDDDDDVWLEEELADQKRRSDDAGGGGGGSGVSCEFANGGRRTGRRDGSTMMIFGCDSAHHHPVQSIS